MKPTADDLDPRGPAAFTALVAHTRAFADSCRRRSRALLSHVDTVSVARDLEAVRQAIGEPSLNWLGFSYGTAIGNTYATLFPQHIRVLAGDGALEHSRPSRLSPSAARPATLGGQPKSSASMPPHPHTTEPAASYTNISKPLGLHRRHCRQAKLLAVGGINRALKRHRFRPATFHGSHILP